MKQSLFRFRVFCITLFLSCALLILTGIFLYKISAQKTASENPQTEFDRFLNNLFVSELEQDPLSLHFLLTNPAAYGIDSNSPALTPYRKTDAQAEQAQLTQLRQDLSAFSPELLSTEQQTIYESLVFSLENNLAQTEYADLSNPFSPHRGIQQQLPLLLSEYRIESQDDIEDYYALLDSVYLYFESLCPLLTEHFENHTIPLSAIRQTAEQCREFLETPAEENILLLSFSERLSALEYLDEVEVAVYEMKNRYRVETELLPAYRLLLETLTSCSSQNEEELGLSSLDGGQEYYTLLAQEAASSDLSVPQMKELLQQYFSEAVNCMKRLAKEYPSLVSQAAEGLREDNTSLYAGLEHASSEEIMQFLQEKSLSLLPSLAQNAKLDVTIKTTSPALQNMTAPAMYLIAPLDSYREHTVYLNPAYSGSNSYTTIAHETFPGHLAARVSFLSQNPNPVRSLTDFIGWDEGWASLAEFYALSYLNQSDTATEPVIEFLCASELAMLCLYGLTDIGIHYDGWTQQDTLDFWCGYGMDEESACALWQLVLSEPAYYLPYSMGLVQMLELRKLAVAALGNSYTESAFCSALLSLGPLPYQLCGKYLIPALQP